ncbi:ATPase [Mesorhizobium sp. L-8-10]|uniref:ATP-binding protein n=1 Tax=Mesorhizobium sp. L-8-10 TaxID=2744523 RepID=UPI00193568DC|nr:ATP-binding protein [Mesorhizobium sp. L-8-10]BCH34313.1 ATPase [Mesorhizobium sp. L-8-10]
MKVAAKPKPEREPETDQPTWYDRNRLAIEAGLAWIDALLDDRLAPVRLPRETEVGSAPRSPAALAARGAYDRAREEMLRAGEPAPIDRVSALFRLSPFEEDVLLLALAPLLRANFASLYAQIHGRAALDKATPHLAMALLAAAGPEGEARAWERLSPEAPLRRFLLVESADRTLTPLTAITLDERVRRLLTGEHSEEPRTQPMLFEAEPASFPERHRAGVERLAVRLETARRPLAVIVGPKRSGRAAAAAALAARFGLGLAVFKPRPFEPTQDLVALVGREAVLGGLALMVDAGQPDVVALLHHRIDALVIAIAETRPDLPFDVPHLRLEALDQADHAALWRETLGPGSAETDERIDALADQFRFGPGEIAAIVAEGGDLRQSCRDRAGRALEELAERIVPRYRWDDMVMPAEILHDLHAVTAQVRHRSLVYVKHGFAKKLVRGRGVSVLLSGPSGTGKTMAAEVIAGELELDLFRIDLSGVVSKYIGETEKNLKAVFDAAEASGAVLFFDEADALFGKRSEVKDSHDRYANIEVSYLLQRMESYGGLAILATNMKGHLDSAFLRRLRFAIDIPFPDAALRRAIWMKAFPEETPKAALDFDALARLDIAGGNIAVIAVNAAFLAAAEGVPLAMRHVARAARAEFRKLDKEFRMFWPEAS